MVHQLDKSRISPPSLCDAPSSRRYVVDAADHGSMEVSRTELHELLGRPSLNGIPLLVLGNKNDKPEAISREELIQFM